MHKRITRDPADGWRSRQGGVAILFALTLTMLIGFSALGTEVVYAMYKQRQMATAASSAALAGATALMTGHPVDFKVETRAIATTAGFTQGTAGATVTINHPPLSGPNAGNANAVEVIVGQPQVLPLSGVFFAGPWNINARAVAVPGNNSGACVLALNPNSTTAVDISITNGANVALSQCGMAANAGGPNALTISNGGILTAKTVTVSGGVTVTGGGSINGNQNGCAVTPGCKTQQPASVDAYSTRVIPTYSGCDHGSAGNPMQVLGWQNPTLNPGIYCGGLSMGNGGTVRLNPGVYIINGGSFSPQGGTVVTGTGVTIVLTGSGTNYATANIANGVNITLSAPTTGATKGLVFFADPRSPATPGSTFGGGAQMVLTGALYFPSQLVSYSNGSSTTATCTQLVAWQISFVGGASFNSNCAMTGVSTIGATPSKLVE